VAVGKVLKLGKLPVKIQLAGQYMPIRTCPSAGQRGAGVEHPAPADVEHSEAHQGAALPMKIRTQAPFGALPILEFGL
jgi:hypothetical protein